MQTGFHIRCLMLIMWIILDVIVFMLLVFPFLGMSVTSHKYDISSVAAMSVIWTFYFEVIHCSWSGRVWHWMFRGVNRVCDCSAIVSHCDAADKAAALTSYSWEDIFFLSFFSGLIQLPNIVVVTSIGQSVVKKITAWMWRKNWVSTVIFFFLHAVWFVWPKSCWLRRWWELLMWVAFNVARCWIRLNFERSVFHWCYQFSNEWCEHVLLFSVDWSKCGWVEMMMLCSVHGLFNIWS